MNSPVPNRLFLAAMATVIVAGAGLLGSQHRHLSSLQAELTWKVQTASARTADLADARSARTSHTRTPESGGSLSTAAEGAEYLAEADALLTKFEPAISGRNAAPYRSMIQSEQYDRLRWILSRMGSQTFLRLQGLHPNPPLSEDSDGPFLGNLFIQMNPRQALELAMMTSSEPGGWYRISKAFSGWSLLEPEAALQWYLANRDHMEALKRPEIASLILPLQVKSQPAAVIGQLLDTISKGRQVDDVSSLPAICQALEQPAERLAFFQALKTAAADPATHDAADALRQKALTYLRQSLMGSPYLDTFPILDAALTPEEKVSFASQMVIFSAPDPKEWPLWASWIAGLDAPADFRHPLIQMAGRSASFPDKYGDPAWLDQIAPGPLRDQAVNRYIQVRIQADPKAAAAWLPRISDNDLRQQLTEQINSRLEQTSTPDPAAPPPPAPRPTVGATVTQEK